MKFRLPPEEYGLTQEEGEALYKAYVTEEKIIPEAIKAASKELGCQLTIGHATKFIRANGWTRSQSFYSRRNPFHGYSRASIEARKAQLKRRGEWVD